MRAIYSFFCSKLPASLRGIVNFYVDGFKSMTIGKSLWALIIIKFVILFLVLKLFFFPDVLKEKYDNDTDRAEAVREALVK